MNLMSTMGEYQAKESPVRSIIIWEHYTTISPEKHDSFKEEGRSSLPEGEWAVTESKRGMVQDIVKIVCQGATPWKMGTFLRGRAKLFTAGWVSCCWVPKEGWCRMKWKLYAKVQRPEKQTSFWEEELNSLPEGE